MRFAMRGLGGLLMMCALRLCGQSTAKPVELSIVGYNDMDRMLASIDDLFERAHPGMRISRSLPGTATGAGALTLGVSALAPMGAEFSSRELAAYRAAAGGDPLPDRVAHCALNPAARSAPVGIYVNAANPLRELTVEQVSRIFTSGSPAGDLTMWSQLIDAPAWKEREIHPCGIAEEAVAGLSPYMLERMGGRRFTATFQPLLQSRDAVQCAANDLGAISFGSANFVDPKTKLVAIASSAGKPYVLPTPADVTAGRYPFDRFLYMYLRKVTGEPLNAMAKEYVLLMLSAEGQRAIAAAAPGYLPLNPAEVDAERRLLK